MIVEIPRHSVDILRSIVSGKTPVEQDRGGHWSNEHGIWVDKDFFDVIEGMPPGEREFAERSIPIALSVAKLFTSQIRDGEYKRMWPDGAYEIHGMDRLIAVSAANPSLVDPYVVLRDGIDKPATPFSRQYFSELRKVQDALIGLLDINSQSAALHRVFIRGLLEAYRYDPRRYSDLPYYRDAEVAWIGISPYSPFLLMAQPMEVYHDPLRIHWSGKDNEHVSEWSRRVTEINELGPWKAFFETRLLLTDESMISPEEVGIVRDTSRRLYGDGNTVISASTEFRRVILSAGNGAHPMKTAKNYPNFTGIRDNLGYKNIHYTNMIRLGTIEKTIPWLKHAFGNRITEGMSEEMLIRGRALGVVGHEENHPFRRFDGEQEMEEFKATINGLWALIVSGRFNDHDIRAVLLTNIGSMLYGKAEIDSMRAKGDISGAGSRDTYHIGNTIFMNILVQQGVFTEEGNIDIERMKTTIRDLVNSLEQYRQDRTGMLTDRSLRDEQVWTRFLIKELS